MTTMILKSKPKTAKSGLASYTLADGGKSVLATPCCKTIGHVHCYGKDSTWLVCKCGRKHDAKDVF